MTKKLLALILSAVMLFSLMPTAVFAETEGVPVGASGYELTAEDVEIYSEGTIKLKDNFDFNTKGTALIIPATIDGVGVTSIGERAFGGCTSLTSITIPDSVTSIGNDAFYGCTSLASITIPGSVTSIGVGAFAYCTSLASITIPGSVTSISDYVFFDCTSLTSITIPEGVTSIGDVAFGGCTSLTSITIPESVTSIGDDAFYGCTSLTAISIPCSITDDMLAAAGVTVSGTGDIYTTPTSGTLTKIHIQQPDDGDCTTALTCACGNNIITAAQPNHTWGEWQQTKAPTCTEKGEQKHSCTVPGCTQSETQPISATGGHSFTNYISDNNATCTADGTKTAKCDNCTETKTITDAGSKLAHNYVNGKCTACGAKQPTKPVTPTKPVEVKPTEQEKAEQTNRETVKKIENTPKGATVTINADDDKNGVHWSIMDAAREKGVGLKIEWNGKTITIPAGKALNEKYRTYYPYEYLAKYDFKNMKPAEIPAIPETGVPVNLIITLMVVALVTTTAVVIKKKVK